MVILVIGDAHMPFVHKPTVSKILDHIQNMQKKPDYIVQVGDLYDFFSASRFPRSFNVILPEDEIMEGRLCAEEFWRMIKKRSPKSICYQLKGNHCDRPIKRVIEKVPELATFFTKGINDYFKFDGVNTIFDSREVLKLEGISFHHGWKTKLGDHAKVFGTNTVVGHSHRPGIIYIPDYGRDNIIWEANAGYIADPEAEALKYTPTKFNNWTRGILEIENNSPRFIML